jgi:hypothetical protein
MDPLRPPDDLDLDNPYAPPRSTFAPLPKPGLQSLSIPFSIDSIATTAWLIYRDNLWTCIWVVWAAALIELGVQMLLAMVMGALGAAMPGDQAALTAINNVLILPIFVFLRWLQIGVTRGLIQIVRGEPVSAEVLFSGGRYLPRVIFALILLVLLYFVLLFIPLMLLAMTLAILRDQMVAGLLTLVAVCATCVFLVIYLGARVMPFYYLIIDRDAGVIESIQLAWQITRGRAGTVFLAYLVQFVLLIAGFLALCVGLVFTVPLSTLLMVVTYLAMVGPAKPADRMPFTAHWEEDV